MCSGVLTGRKADCLDGGLRALAAVIEIGCLEVGGRWGDLWLRGRDGSRATESKGLTLGRRGMRASR